MLWQVTIAWIETPDVKLKFLEVIEYYILNVYIHNIFYSIQNRSKKVRFSEVTLDDLIAYYRQNHLREL